MAKEDNIPQTPPQTGEQAVPPQAQEPVKKSKKDLFMERMHTRHPGDDFSDEEAFYGRLGEDYDAYDKQGRDVENIRSMFASDPRSAAFLADLAKADKARREGGEVTDPVVALIRRFGDDFKAALEDPKLQDKIAEANEDYVKRVAENKKLADEYAENEKKTLALIEQKQKELGLDDSVVDDVIAFIRVIVADGLVGKLKPETFDLALKAVRHDSDVAEAQNEGEVRGRNAKIDESLKKGKQGDGLPSLQGKNSTARPRGGNSIFAIAEDART